MSAELDSLIRMARWGREQDKRNIVADLAPLCEIADEVERLRAELAQEHRRLVATEEDLAHERMELGEAILEVERLRTELAAAKAEPPRPEAIVYASEGVLHAFEDCDEAITFSDAHALDIGGISQWIWHPKSP